MKKQRYSGFTLIEMLVVIGIILILAAILYPALMNAMESGRKSKCTSNLHQLQLAALNYASDAGGVMPAAVCSDWYPPDANHRDWWHIDGWVAWSTHSYCTNTVAHQVQPNGYAWYGDAGLACITNGPLYGYIKGGEGVYCCPTFSKRSNCGVSNPWRSYSMNTNASSFNYISGRGQVDVVLFGDDSSLVGNAFADSGFSTNQLARWHTKKTIVVYVDGHIEQQ